MTKDIMTVCIPCGRKHGKKNKGVMGIWIDTCDICGKEKVGCASAAHDFGIYSSEKQKIQDKIQDAI